MSVKRTAPSIRAMKGQTRIVCLTAYDVMSAEIADGAGVDLILVGDSLGNVIQGHPTTIPVSLEDMGYHVRAVRRGAENALLVADLPFGSYQSSVAQAVDSAVYLMKQGAEGVKLEGDYPEAIKAISKAGIPVLGHVGFTPQSVHGFGGFRVQGREDGEAIVDTAQRLDAAGAFGIVLELMPAALSAQITQSVSCPTVGIGAGPHCDGEIQVWHDVLGLGEKVFKHSKRYVDARSLFLEGLSVYCLEVRENRFPGPENSF